MHQHAPRIFLLLLALLLLTLPSAQAQEDSDGDGVNDSDDAYPDNPDAWSDSDGDGYADQPNTNISDDCPNTFGKSRRYMLGCKDMDRDWVPDLLDDDIDGDGITNAQEKAASNALMQYDPFNPDSVPPDSDFDTIPDVLDEDDDNDGWTDEVELERGSDPFDENDTPFNMYGGNSGWFFVAGEGFTTEHQESGIEVSVSWVLSALSSELIIPIGLVPLYIAIWVIRHRNFVRFDAELESLDTLEDLKAAEERINEYLRRRRIHTYHGLILRNVVEGLEDRLDSEWSENSPRYSDSEE